MIINITQGSTIIIIISIMVLQLGVVMASSTSFLQLPRSSTSVSRTSSISWISAVTSYSIRPSHSLYFSPAAPERHDYICMILYILVVFFCIPLFFIRAIWLPTPSASRYINPRPFLSSWTPPYKYFYSNNFFFHKCCWTIIHTFFQ